jgi:hypothetical protein
MSDQDGRERLKALVEGEVLTVPDVAVSQDDQAEIAR